MNNSKIEWTDDSSNPIRVKDSKTFYCAKISKGCENCYSEVLSKRLAAMGGTEFFPFMNMKKPPELELHRNIIQGWAHKKRPRKIFVSSMTDVFGEFVRDEWIFEILDAMIAAPLQTFQVLTKRAKRMKELVDQFCELRDIQFLPKNIWLMVSVENQECADTRIPELLKSKCLVRGLSCEPMLGAIDLTAYIFGIHWVVCGGESGNKARPMHPDWAISLRDQCKNNKVAFFFKQWGQYANGSNVNTTKSVVVFNNGDYVLSSETMEYVKAKNISSSKFFKYIPTVMHKVAAKHESGKLLEDKEYMEFPLV